MTQPALRLVSDTGEVVEPADAAEWRERYEGACKLLRKKQALLDTASERIDKLVRDAKFREAGAAKAAAKGAQATDVRDVLLHHREVFLKLNARIVPNSQGWRFVEKLLTMRDADGDVAFTPKDLCDSVDGAWLDDWYRANPRRGYATSVFGSYRSDENGRSWSEADPDKVQRNIDRLRESLGQAPYDLAALPDYVQENVALWLSEECGCGHVRAQHVNYRSGCCGTVRSEPRWSVCRCSRFAPGGNL